MYHNQIKVITLRYLPHLRAPSDCYQFFTGTSGEVKSFNYPNVMIAGSIYTMCVRQESGYCGIEWSAAATTIDSFQLTDISAVDPAIAPAAISDFGFAVSVLIYQA